MRTALDDPATALDAGEAEFVDQVREHGWFDTHVFGDEALPGFSYTTGFWLASQMPEIILFSLKRGIAHKVLWDLFRDFTGGVKHPVGVPVSGIFGNAHACLFPVAKAHYAEHLGWSRWFYRGDDFPCLQLVWPDRAGIFPWQAGFDETFRSDQPDLTEKGWIAALAD